MCSENKDSDILIINGREFTSRLFIGTGKFSSSRAMADAVIASKSEMVTVALRRVDIDDPQDDIMSALSGLDLLILPNTSGARDAKEAVRLAHIARAGGCEPWIKLEVTPEPNYLLPDPIETLRAAEILVKDGFTVLPYIHADPILAKRLQDVGVHAVMPLGSPIGSNQGIKTRSSIEIIIEQAQVPVVVDAGLGTASHAAEAMEMGADAVLVNTAIAVSKDPALMAHSFMLGTIAGREAYLAGIPVEHKTAEASSPITGFLRE
jgi:thiazole synthase